MPYAPQTFRLTPRQKRGVKSRAAEERSNHYRTKEWFRIRQSVMVRDGMMCQMCQKNCMGKYNAHVDHIKPLVEGGTDDMENLRLLCQRCHNARTATDSRGGGVNL